MSTYHGQDDRKVIPPKSVDDENASEQAKKQEEDHEHEEESSEAVDGRLPVTLCGGHGSLWCRGILRGGLWLLSNASSMEVSRNSRCPSSNGIADKSSLGCYGGELRWPRRYIGHVHLVSASH